MPILETPKSEIYLNITNTTSPLYIQKSFSLTNSPLVSPNLEIKENTIELSGKLLKWTDYFKGYKKRWFVLNNGILSYYSIKNKMAYACRGSINLANASIENEYFSTTFKIYDGQSRKFYLKAKNEYEKQKWLIAIEISKNKLIREDFYITNEYQILLNDLKIKLNDLNQCYSLVVLYNNDLEKLLNSIEKLCFKNKDSNNNENMFDIINEKAKSMKICLNLILNNMKTFTNIANKIGENKESIMEIEYLKKKHLDDMIQKFDRLKNNFKKIDQKTNKNLICIDIENETPTLKKNDYSDRPKLNKTKTETQLTSTSNNLIDNHLKFKQNSYIDFKQTMVHKNIIFDNDDFIVDDFDDNIEYHDAVEIVEKYSLLGLNHQINKQQKQRRKEIPERPNSNLNCIEFIKNCVGKSIDEIPIPFNYREPLSMLQRLVEEIEYTDLLDKASKCNNQWEQMAYVAAFAVSCYGTTPRTFKPFNSLLGETYEYDCSNDIGEGVGWRAIAEQISVTPPTTVLNVESITNDWQLYNEFKMTSKFRLQYIQVIPTCITHLVFKKTGYHYTWSKVNTFVHNLMVGKMWVENVGDLDIVNHSTKDVCHLKFTPYNYFSKTNNKVNGIITDSNNIAYYVVNGIWSDYIEKAAVIEPKVLNKQNHLKTDTPSLLFKRKQISSHIKNMYNFSDFTIKLNEPENDVAPTDSRNRPDQRLMEQGLWDEASKENLRIEDKQKNILKIKKDYQPLWFEKTIDPYTNQVIHVFKNEYWTHKQNKDWNCCPHLF